MRFSLCASLFWLVLMTLVAEPAHTQVPDSAAAIARQLRRHEQHALMEKLYLHLDRPVYAARETMWFTLYTMDGTRHRPLALSKVAYVEVLNALRQPVLQTQIALHEATGHGSLVLPATLPIGRYRVRAYTSWMKNFAPEFFFQTDVAIINTFAPSGGVAAPPAPVSEVQFFPEGGQLVQGVPSRVGFRVADAAGRGQAAAGVVRDAQGQVVATLRTLRAGLGSFVFTPAVPGTAYTAEVQLAAGPKLVQKLPAVASQGYVLRLTDTGSGQLHLRVTAKGVGADASRLALVGHSGQHIAVVQEAQSDAHGEVDFLIPKAQLLAGISHLTVFNRRRQPVGERLCFRRPRSLPLSLSANQPHYGPRAPVTLRLTLPAGAAPTRLSVSVYQLDSLTAGATPADISTFLHLTSDLKGTVENPGSYLQDSSQVGQEATDNLMLTHGWSRFRWAEVLAGERPALPYPPELNGPLVRGQVLTAAGRPAPNVAAYLAVPSRTARFYTAFSQADGVVQFEPKDWFGTRQLVLQTDWRRDSTYKLTLLSPYAEHSAPQPAAPLQLIPELAADITRRHVQAQLQSTYFSRNQQYRLPPPDTMPMYGRPPALYNLDDYTRFKTLEEVLREYVQNTYVRTRKDGFHLALGDEQHHAIFESDPLVLLDGVPVFDLNALMAFDPLRIQRVGVFATRYFNSAQSYDGLLSFTTYQGNLQDFPLDPRALLQEYEALQGQREFFAPRYDSPSQQQSSLPDRRNLLHWQPGIALAPGTTQELTFFTSDQVGRYAVVVQGLAADGQAGSARAVLEVKPAL